MRNVSREMKASSAVPSRTKAFASGQQAVQKCGEEVTADRHGKCGRRGHNGAIGMQTICSNEYDAERNGLFV